MNPALVLIVVARVLGLGATAPVLATPGLEPRFRLILGAAIALVILPAVGPMVTVPSSWGEIAALCLGEAIVGAGLGWAAGLVVAGARQAGEVVGAQAGLSAAALFDPDAGDDLTPLGHLYGLIALGVFLAMDGPLLLVRALVESYATIPVGVAGLSIDAVEIAFGCVGKALALAVRIAAPTAIAMSLAGLALGLIGRAAPSLPMATMALPVRYAVGLTLAMLGALTIAGTIAATWRAWPIATGGG